MTWPSRAEAPVPSMSIGSCGVVRNTAQALVAMAIQRGLKEEHDEAFLAWAAQQLRNELARRRNGELR